jgi:hypothetical protein
MLGKMPGAGRASRTLKRQTPGMESMKTRIFAATAAVLASVAAAPPAGAQTDYYNTDKGRPVTIEDAYPV